MNLAVVLYCSIDIYYYYYHIVTSTSTLQLLLYILLTKIKYKGIKKKESKK